VCAPACPRPSGAILPGVRHRLISIRWWLALTFALISALTAVAVAELYTQRAENAFRGRAQDLAAGATVSAAEALRVAVQQGQSLQDAVTETARSRRLALFVFDANGHLLTGSTSHGVPLGAVPSAKDALARALDGQRYVQSFDRGRSIVVGLRLRAGRSAALVARASRPELRAELGIVHNEIVKAALIAVGAGAAVGLLVALFIGARLRRIASAALAIEGGSFDTKLVPGFPDELGALAATVDRMRERLRESFESIESERDRLRRLLERLHQGVVAVDARLNVQFANGVAARMVGATLGEGDPLPEPWPDFSLCGVARNLFARDATVAEARLSVDADHTYAVVGIPPGRGSGTAILVLTDVSERERRERSEREFVANAAHELRTPVTAIAAAVEALQAGAAEDAARRGQFLAVIDRQTGRLGRLIRALLVLARAQTRQEPLRLEPVELRSILHDVAEGLSPREGVAVEVRCASGLYALAERVLTEQVVANLAANAVKHTSKGLILLSAEPTDDGFVAIEVSDTGPGIQEDARDRVFDRFYSAGENGREGFGLGLAIVSESVRALGGVIEVDSTAGTGTTVRVTLAGEEKRS
jgi:signal transduction histidine kinase/HAMP domain-containing protein